MSRLRPGAATQRKHRGMKRGTEEANYFSRCSSYALVLKLGCDLSNIFVVRKLTKKALAGPDGVLTGVAVDALRLTVLSRESSFFALDRWESKETGTPPLSHILSHAGCGWHCAQLPSIDQRHWRSHLLSSLSHTHTHTGLQPLWTEQFYTDPCSGCVKV